MEMIVFLLHPHLHNNPKNLRMYPPIFFDLAGVAKYPERIGVVIALSVK
jgi:hypothetical protein